MLIDPGLPSSIIVQGEEYRLVYNANHSYISCNGEVYDLEKEKKTTITIAGGYKYFSYRTPQGAKNLSVHRAVAFAWVPNPDPVELTIVNHIDGIPFNCHYKNLEWSTYTGNNLHAVNSGLRSDNIRCKVRNFETKEIMSFPSVVQACQYMGLSKHLHVSQLRPKKFGTLLLDKYEFRYEEEETPWFYENRTEKIKPVRYIVNVENADGTKEEVFSNRTMLYKFKLYDAPDKSIPGLVAHANLLYPDKKFTYIDSYIFGWHKVKRDVKPVKRTKIRAEKNGTEIEFDSITKTAEYFGVDRSVISLRIRAGTRYNGWRFYED